MPNPSRRDGCRRTRRRTRLARPALVLLALLLLPALAVLAPAPAGAQAAPSPDVTAGAIEGVDRVDADALRAGLRQVIAEARDQVFPALVSIRVVTASYRGGRELKGTATGSGTIISEQGHVLTNQHVTRGGRSFVCTLSDRREVDAELIGEDPLTDLAVLRLDLEALGAGPLPVARLGDSDALETGDYVMAMGSPFSLSRSVSLGIVANTERVFAAGFGSDDIDEMELEQGQRTGLFTRWIQHDALINPGNSGGPLVDLDGEVIGVNELGGNAMGFAIPANLARRVADALIAHGEVPRSWLGLSFKPIRRTGHERGVLVDSVELDGPAARAGIAAGDLVVAIDAEPLTVRFPEEVPPLLDRLASLPIGAEVVLSAQRDGETGSFTVHTERLTRDVGDETAFHAWGISAQEITPKLARDHRLDGTEGVLVTGVRAGGPAQLAEPALDRGDVIVALDGEEVGDLAALIARYEALDRVAAEEDAGTEPEPRPLLFAFDRRGQHHVTLLDPRRDDVDDPPRELPKAWIGIATQPLPPRLAAALELDGGSGFRITRVYPGTEAERAGLLVGDVVTAIAGEPLDPRGVQDSGMLARQVRALPIGETATLTVLRGDQPHEMAVKLERTRLTPEEARSHRDVDFELTVRELTFFDRDENRWDPSLRGVLVTQTDPGGWAHLGGLRPRDLIQRIVGHEVRGLKSFRQALTAIERERPERIEVVVLRGVRTRFQYLEPDWSPREDE